MEARFARGVVLELTAHTQLEEAQFARWWGSTSRGVVFFSTVPKADSLWPDGEVPLTAPPMRAARGPIAEPATRAPVVDDFGNLVEQRA